jgi:hypothetical protein
VEQLEDRRLCSVSVPVVVDLHATVDLGGTLTVKILSNDDPGQVLLQAPSLTVQILETVQGSTVTRTLGQPLSSTRTDLNGDGTPDLVLQFAGTNLRGLVAGTATVDVQGSLPDGTTADSNETFNLRGTATGGNTNAGHVTRPKHHHRKHHTHQAQVNTPRSTGTMTMSMH